MLDLSGKFIKEKISYRESETANGKSILSLPVSLLKTFCGSAIAPKAFCKLELVNNKREKKYE